MSQQLADYIAARHAAIVAVLEMLTADCQLSDERSSVLAVTSAEDEAEQAARALTDAVNALPVVRRPAGWSKPPDMTGDVRRARQRYVMAALRCLAAQYAGESADADASAEYADEQLALAARNLAADADAHRAAKAEAGGRLL